MNRPPRILFGALALLSLVVGCDKPKSGAGLPPPVMVPGSASAAPAQPATPTSFQEVTAQLDAGGSFYLYLSTQQWVAGLSQQIAEAREGILNAAASTAAAKASPADTARVFDLAKDLVAQSGIEEVTGVGVSSFALAPQVTRSKFFLHHAPGKGTGFLWKLTGEKPHALEALQMLPAQTALASIQDWDPTLLQTAVAQGLERLGTPEMKASYTQALTQVSSILGMPLEEALRSMKGPGGLLLTLDAAKPVPVPGQDGVTMPTPGLALVFHLTDARVFDQLDKTFGTGPQIVRVDEPGLKMRTMAELPLPLPFTVRPTVALWGEYLILATTDQLVRDMAAAKTGGLASTPEFRQLAADMPTTGNGFQVTTKLFSDTVAQLQSQMLKAQPTATPQQAQLMQQVFARTAGTASFAVSSHLENGWLVTGKQVSSGAAKTPWGTFFKAMVASLPSSSPADLQPATVVGLEGDSQAHARQLWAACTAYAADNAGQYPPSLDELVPRYLTDMKILASPFAPAVRQGYKYTPGLTQDAPKGTVLLEDTQAVSGHWRIVVHVDGSDEVTKLP